LIESEERDKFARVAQKVFPHSRLLRTWPLQGGLSAQMTALEVMLPDGRTKKLIVRRPGKRAVTQNPRAAADEFRILQIVQSAGVTVQTPYLLDQSGEIFSEPYLVIEYIEGDPEFSPANITAHVRQIATQLAKIHAINEARLDLAFLPQQAEQLAHAFNARPAKLDDSLDEARIRNILEAVWPLPPRNAPVLLHGDFWPGNILWQGGRLVGVIDWEDASAGDPLADLAVSRLDILWIFGLDAMHAFTRHYQTLLPIDLAQLPYWDLYAALRPASRIAEWAEGWPALGRPDITEETMRAGHRGFREQAIEKIVL
jgi:aminoglycoside phosphotransferase (APT) family kinase protein